MWAGRETAKQFLGEGATYLGREGRVKFYQSHQMPDTVVGLLDAHSYILLGEMDGEYGIEAIATHPQRKGKGRELIEAAKRFMRQEGIGVSVPMPESFYFFKKVGVIAPEATPDSYGIDEEEMEEIETD